MDTTSTKFRHERLSVVHGGFNGAWVWDDVAEQLQDAGHRIRVVDQLPSAGTDPTSLADLGVDVSYVRQMLDTPDEPVVLVGHSYAGMVITEFADHPKVGTVSISRRPGHSAGSQC